MKELRKIGANRDNTVLVVIDMQKEMNSRGSDRSEPIPAHPPGIGKAQKRAAIPAVRSLMDRAHEAGVPVICVQSVRNHLEPEFTVYEYNPILKIGTQNSEFFDEVVPEPGDFTVRKWCHDPWFETDLERVLDGLVPDPTKCQVLITGGAGTGCAFFGTNGFYVRNYQTVFVLDGVYGGPTEAAANFSRTSYPTYPNIFLSRSDLIEFSKVTERVPAGR